MAGNSKRRGAVRKEGTKKGMVVGSGGQRRRALEGKGPTPPAERRPGHAKAAAAARNAKRAGVARPKVARRRPGDGETTETVLGRNPVVECLREGPKARQTQCGPRNRLDAGRSRLMVTSPGRVAECGTGSPLLHVVFSRPWSPTSRRILVSGVCHRVKGAYTSSASFAWTPLSACCRVAA